MIGPGRDTIDLDPKANGMVVRRHSQHEMKISCVKTIGNATRLIVERREFTADRPNTRHAPVIEWQRGYDSIMSGSILLDNARRDEVPSLFETDISLRRTQIAFVRGSLRTYATHTHDVPGNMLPGGFFQQRLNQSLRLGITALAEDLMTHTAVGADELKRRPCLVVERPPDSRSLSMATG